MINQNEVRIDNWVEYTPSIGVPEYTQINAYNICDIAGETECANHGWQERYNPIPLTPEILEKAGFKSDSHFDGYALNIHDSEDGSDVYFDIQIYFTRTTGGGIIPHPTIMQGYDGGIYELHPHATIKFVHQLQNLYFSLTGEELNITL